MKKWWRYGWCQILVVWLAFVAAVYGVSYWASSQQFLPYIPSYPSSEELARWPLPTFLVRLSGFDGVHYLHIVSGGYYTLGGVQAFFPLYPLAIYVLNYFTHDSIVSGLLISCLAGYGFLLLLYRWVDRHYGRSLAWRTILVTLLAPASFYLVCLYSESLFLALLLAALTTYDHKKYWWTAIFCALLTACRIVGICLPLVLLVREIYMNYKQKTLFSKQNLRKYAILCLGSSGLFSYMAFLNTYFGDPLYFMTVQNSFGAGRQTSSLVLLPQVIYRYVKIFASLQTYNLMTYALLQEFILSLGALFILVYIAYKYWRTKQRSYSVSLWLFSVLIYLIPPLTGNFSSMPRYLLPCLIINIFMARNLMQKPKITGLIIIMCSLALVCNLCLFVQGFWVA